MRTHRFCAGEFLEKHVEEFKRVEDQHEYVCKESSLSKFLALAGNDIQNRCNGVGIWHPRKKDVKYLERPED